MAAIPLHLPRDVSSDPCRSAWQASRGQKMGIRFLYSTIRASQSFNGKKQVYKQLGFFSYKRKIEDAVLRAEMLAPIALEIEETTRIKQEETLRDHNLWDDPVKSNEILAKLADSANLVDSLKDLKYKAEEAKLISLLAGKKAIKNRLFKQAYDASVDVCRFLDHYEMCKLLKGSHDMEGACVIIKAGSESICSEMWVEQLLSMYCKWAEKQGFKGRVVEKHPSKNCGITSATIEFEYKYAYGYLSGERGLHCLMNNQDRSVVHVDAMANVDVIPLFLEAAGLQFDDDDDLMISSHAPSGEQQGRIEPAVCIQHIPTGISIQSSGERSNFANKIKALNRLKAKLLVIAREQGVSGVSSITKDSIVHVQHHLIRRYTNQPYKLVEDVKTGVQLTDLNSVLDGNIEPLIAAHIRIRQEST